MSRDFRSTRGSAAAVAGTACWLVLAGAALAQSNQPPPAAGFVSAQQPAAAVSPAPALPPQPPPPTERRGLFNDFGKWWDQSIADFKTRWKEQQTKIDDFNKQSADAAKSAATATSEAMKNAADAMRFSHVVEVQEKCPIAGNGAADCATAATNACKTKGYNNGQPLDVRTAEKCTDSLWVSGQRQTAADCPVETVVLRVACQ